MGQPPFFCVRVLIIIIISIFDYGHWLDSRRYGTLEYMHCHFVLSRGGKTRSRFIQRGFAQERMRLVVFDMSRVCLSLSVLPFFFFFFKYIYFFPFLLGCSLKMNSCHHYQL